MRAPGWSEYHGQDKARRCGQHGELPDLLERIREPSSSNLRFSDEAKIETEQEEDEMDDGAATADLRCFDKTCPQQRHRNIGEIEIEQNAR